MADGDFDLGNLATQYGGLFGVYEQSQAIAAEKDEEKKKKLTQDLITSFHDLPDTAKMLGLIFMALTMHSKGAQMEWGKLFTPAGRDELEQNLLSAEIADKSNGKMDKDEAGAFVQGTLDKYKAEKLAQQQTPANAPTQATPPAPAAPVQTAPAPTAPSSPTQNGNGAYTLTLPIGTLTFTPAAQTSVPAKQTTPATPPVATQSTTPLTRTPTLPVSPPSTPAVDLVTQAEKLFDPQHKGLTLKDRPELKPLIEAKVIKMFEDAKKEAGMLGQPRLIGAEKLVLKNLDSLSLKPEDLHAFLTAQQANLEKIAGKDGKLTKDNLLTVDAEKQFIDGIAPTDLAKKLDAALGFSSGLKTV